MLGGGVRTKAENLAIKQEQSQVFDAVARGFSGIARHDPSDGEYSAVLHARTSRSGSYILLVLSSTNNAVVQGSISST